MKIQEPKHPKEQSLFLVSQSTGIFSCKQVDCVKEKQEIYIVEWENIIRN